MDIPDANAPIWRAIVTKQKDANFSFLGLKFLLVKLENSAHSEDKKIQELRAMIVKNAKHPKVQSDLKRLFR